jgi:hypothetical protein
LNWFAQFSARVKQEHNNAEFYKTTLNGTLERTESIRNNLMDLNPARLPVSEVTICPMTEIWGVKT